MIIGLGSQGSGELHTYTNGFSKFQVLTPLWGRKLWGSGLNLTPEGTISHQNTVLTNGEVRVWVKISSWAFLFWCEINYLKLFLGGLFVGFFLTFVQ